MCLSGFPFWLNLTNSLIQNDFFFWGGWVKGLAQGLDSEITLNTGTQLHTALSFKQNDVFLSLSYTCLSKNKNLPSFLMLSHGSFTELLRFCYCVKGNKVNNFSDQSIQ